MGERAHFEQKYSFHWDLLDTILSGKSLLDSQMGLSGFPLLNVDDAERFLRSYGYDLDRPVERAEVLGNLHEAIHFVRRYFLQPDNPEGLKLDIPRKILELSDPRELLLMASESNGTPKLHQAWACSLLKMVHTIAHLDKDVRTQYFPETQKQILDRFYRVIHRDEKNQLFLGATPDDPLRVDLVAFETKPKKPRDSILIKLLHKRENVAEDIFDRVGLRFITRDRLDAVRVVKFLKDQMIIMPANNKPSRARNSLVDLKVFSDKVKAGLPALINGTCTEEEFRASVQNGNVKDKAQSENVHSSDEYRSIQFTARQLIKLVNPLYDQLKLLKSKASLLPESDVRNQIEQVDLKFLSREIRFFYPFEVQIVDFESSLENEQGKSAHKEYRKAQIHTAMRRVMGSLCDGQHTN